MIGVCRLNRDFLVIRRAASLRAGGKLCFPGGHVEAGECNESALRREIFEELGVDVVVGNKLAETWSLASVNLRLNWYSIDGIETDKLRPSRDEVSEVYWLSYNELLMHGDLLSSNRDFLISYRDLLDF